MAKPKPEKEGLPLKETEKARKVVSRVVGDRMVRRWNESELGISPW